MIDRKGKIRKKYFEIQAGEEIELLRNDLL